MKGGSNNVFSANSTATGVNVNFEQHASVSVLEEIGMNLMGYRIVDVAQKLDLTYTRGNGQLSVSASTGVFPSATLSVSGNNGFVSAKLMQYNQPSFVETHTAPKSTYGPGQSQRRNYSYYPTKFTKR